MKNIIFLGLGSELLHSVLHRIIKDNPSIETVFTIKSFDSKKLEIPSHIKVVVFDFYKINVGDYESDLKQYNISPVPIAPELLQSFTPYVFNTLKIMDRLPDNQFYSFQSRTSLMLKHLEVWSYIFKEYKIDHVVSMDMPHEAQDYTIYALSILQNIKLCYFAHSQIPHLVQITNRIENLHTPFKDLENYRNDVIQDPLTRDYYFKQTNENYTPFYMIDPKENILSKLIKKLTYIKIKLINFSKKFKAKKNLFEQIYLFNKFSTPAYKRLLAFRSSIEISPDLKQKYIYVPLHFQPERTTAPQGGIHAFQELMIGALSNAASSDTTIYVKEHGRQTQHGRDIDFYKKILTYKNVKIISSSTPSLDLIKNSYITATVTGTSGWEAFCLQKPVFIFGNVYFATAPGVFKIENQSDLKSALDKIEKGEIENNKERVIQYLNCVSEKLIHGFSDEMYFPVSGCDWEENLVKISNEITKFFKY